MKTEPTELNKKEPVLAVNHMGDWTDEGKSITTDICYKWLKIAFQEGQFNPKIKQLEWEEGDFCFRSITKFGQYTISKPTSLRDRQVFVVYFNEMYIKSWNTPEEAKAFAQDDFEARIKKCLITE